MLVKQNNYFKCAYKAGVLFQISQGVELFCFFLADIFVHHQQENCVDTFIDEERFPP